MGFLIIVGRCVVIPLKQIRQVSCLMILKLAQQESRKLERVGREIKIIIYDSYI